MMCVPPTRRASHCSRTVRSNTQTRDQGSCDMSKGEGAKGGERCICVGRSMAHHPRIRRCRIGGRFLMTSQEMAVAPGTKKTAAFRLARQIAETQDGG